VIDFYDAKLLLLDLIFNRTNFQMKFSRHSAKFYCKENLFSFRFMIFDNHNVENDRFSVSGHIQNTKTSESTGFLRRFDFMTYRLE